MRSRISIAAAIAAIAAVAAGTASAQQPSPQDPLTGQASLGYLATSGNTESTNASAGFGLMYLRDEWAHDLDLSAVAATSNDVRTAEAYSSKYETRRAFGERGYLFMALDWRQDMFSAYDRQVSESIGYGRRLVDGARHVLNAEIGTGARQAELRDGPEQDDAIGRAALDYAWMFSEMTGLTHDLVVESGSENTSVESITAVRARLVGNIGLVVSYRVKRNSDVPAGIEDTDSFTSVALEYAF
jgi:putative salt-induced outer membrane protein